MSDFVTPPAQIWRLPVTAARRAEQKPDENSFKAGYTWSETSAFQEMAGDDAYYDMTNRGHMVLSSVKRQTDRSCPISGIHELLDQDVENFWQTEGELPHFLNIEYNQRTAVSFLALYMDSAGDESYTPKKITVQLGNSMMYLYEPNTFSFEKPQGWQYIDLRQIVRRRGKILRESPKTFFLRMQIEENNLSGRDCKIRHFRVIGPRPDDPLSHCDPQKKIVSSSGLFPRYTVR